MNTAYREVLADWDDARRLRWGHRANALQDSGLSWREAEERAYREVLEEDARRKPRIEDRKTT